jgi:hypothetical protein
MYWLLRENEHFSNRNRNNEARRFVRETRDEHLGVFDAEDHSCLCILNSDFLLIAKKVIWLTKRHFLYYYNTTHNIRVLFNDLDRKSK